MSATNIRNNRCVYCGREKEQHGPGLLCVGSSGREGKVYGTKNLPDGATCGTCVHVSRCTTLFGVSATDERCDFFPIRYRAAVKVEHNAEQL